MRPFSRTYHSTHKTTPVCLVRAGIVFDMGQRERKPTMNYDVDSYYRSALKVRKRG